MNSGNKLQKQGHLNTLLLFSIKDLVLQTNSYHVGKSATHENGELPPY